jgi:SHAQKYF class myb-like DNA-binding protein
VFLILVVILLADAIPKKILELMNVENLTRDNVASHLQVFFFISYALLLYAMKTTMTLT